MRVFLSSTVGPLATHRLELRREIARKLGWEAWAFEVDAISAQHPWAQLDERIRSSDIVVCLVADSYGSMIPHDRVSVAEREIWTARRYGKPIQVFVDEALRPPSEPADERQRALLALLLNDPSGFMVKFFSSRGDLRSKVVRDLREWDRRGRPKPHVPAIWLLRDQRTFPSFHSHAALDAPVLGLDYLAQKVVQLEHAREDDRYGDALNLGLQLVPSFRSLPLKRAGEGELELLARFLRVFYNILAVSGHVATGSISAVALAKAWWDVELKLGRLQGAVTAARCASGVLNTAGEVDLALRWNDWADQRRGLPEEEAMVLDSRAHILRSKGDIHKAIALSRRASQAVDGPSADRGYTLAIFAGTVIRSRRRPGWLDGVLAHAEAEAGSGLAKVVFVNETLSYVHRVDPDRASRLVDEARQICSRLGLSRPRAELETEVGRLGI